MSGAMPTFGPYDDELEQGDPEYAAPTCDSCGAAKEWVICHKCNGEGGRDSDELMQEDPLWYDGIDWEDCDDCNGEGGYYLCPSCEMK